MKMVGSNRQSTEVKMQNGREILADLIVLFVFLTAAMIGSVTFGLILNII